MVVGWGCGVGAVEEGEEDEGVEEEGDEELFWRGRVSGVVVSWWVGWGSARFVSCGLVCVGLCVPGALSTGLVGGAGVGGLLGRL